MNQKRTFRPYLHRLFGIVLAAAALLGAAASLTPAASAGPVCPTGPPLLFYGSAGNAYTGGFDACSSRTFRILHHDTLPSGWTHASAAGKGRLLFYDTTTGAAATGSLDPAGIYTPLKSDLRLNPGWSVVTYAGFYRMLLFYNAATGAASTGNVYSDGSYANLQNYMLTPGWTSIAPIGYTGGKSIVFFYNATTGAAKTALFAPDGSYTELQDLQVNTGWTHVIITGKSPCGSTCSTHPGLPLLLFYNATTGAASTGEVFASGDFANLANFRLDRGWTSVARNGLTWLNDFGGTTWNTVVFYNAANGYASRGKIVAARCCSTHGLGEYVQPHDYVGFPTAATLVVAP